MKKSKILIVEDEFVLYDEMKDFLSEKGFEIAAYTKNYAEAINQITTFKPDIVLLDINLEEEKDGIDIGEYIQKNHAIPFLYITNFDDSVTFNRALRTKPNHFIAKAKPDLDLNQLYFDIRFILNKTKKELKTTIKNGILALKDYLNDLKEQQTNSGDFLSRELIEFKDISYLSRENYLKKPSDKTKTKVKTNYFRIVTKDNLSYFYNTSLTSILSKLPNNFMRISDCTIVNISSEHFDGTINNSKISINGITFTISDSYKKKFKSKLAELYET